MKFEDQEGGKCNISDTNNNTICDWRDKICTAKWHHPEELPLQKPLYRHSCLHVAIYQECVDCVLLSMLSISPCYSLFIFLLMSPLVLQQPFNCSLVS